MSNIKDAFSYVCSSPPPCETNCILNGQTHTKRPIQLIMNMNMNRNSVLVSMHELELDSLLVQLNSFVYLTVYIYIYLRFVMFFSCFLCVRLRSAPIPFIFYMLFKSWMVYWLLVPYGLCHWFVWCLFFRNMIFLFFGKKKWN